MSCQLSEDELLSGLDRQAPEIAAHLSDCPECRIKAEEYKLGIHAFSSAVIPPEQPIPTRIGSYLVHRRLGHGGMGVVYEAEQQVPRRMVAIKVVRGGQHVDEYRLRLFEREAQTLAKLRHPGIAAVYEGGRAEDGQPFFAMELVRGAPLNEFLRSGEVSRPKRLELFRRICSAINYAHQRGVIHRDLKPTNILIDAEGNPKILDFGLARITDPDGAIKTETLQVGRIMGTLPYMSPEEARGNPDEIDVRSDLYSLGVVFYEMLTGELPYALHNRGIPEAIRIICEDAPRRPRMIDRSLGGDLETIAMKALEKEPARRYQSVAAMSEDVERYLHNEPILARRASTLYHLRKFVVRHRFVAFFAAALLGMVATVWLWAHHTEKVLLAGAETAINIEVLRSAINEERLAQAYHEVGRFDKAESFYRNSLDTFLRLGARDRAAANMVGYASLLMERPAAEGGDKERDYAEAQDLLWDAVEIFQEGGDGAFAELLRTLEKLRLLYSPEHWDFVEPLATVEKTIADLTAQPARRQSPPM